MSEPFRIEFEWLGAYSDSEIDRAFAASIGVALGDHYLTLNEDVRAQTVRHHMRGCGYQLAIWFATNWWRLRWEPEPDYWWSNVDWRMTHSMGSAGGGFVWPNIIFAGDGEGMEIDVKPSKRRVRFEPINYFSNFHARIGVGDYERQIDRFLEDVLSRGSALKVKDRTLAELWSEVVAERIDPETAERRKLEAMAGYDPDELPDKVLRQLLRDQEQIGRGALEEVTADARHQVNQWMQPIRRLAIHRDNPGSGGFRVSFPSFKLDKIATNKNLLPWQRATHLAKLARESFGFGLKPIKNRALAGILGIKSDVFTDTAAVKTRIPFAVRRDHGSEADIYFHNRYPVNRRFAVSRLIGDQLGFLSEESLMPATHAKTARQKFQRAFAQEFLCPYDALMETIRTEEPSEDEITDAAERFEVSPWVVKTTLVNKGEMNREALN